MTATAWVLSTYCAIALFLHAASIAVVWVRSRRPARVSDAAPAHAVSIIRPVCGLDSVEEVTLASSFKLAWPETELLFCVASPADPAIPLLRRLIAAHRHQNARILIGDNRETANPKLNNVIKGWQAAS